LEATLPAVAVKAAEAAPAGTVTEDGADNSALFDANATMDPPEGAAALSSNAQVVEAPDARFPAPHCSEDTVAGGAVSAIEADCELPLSVAVTLAL
jgi:hypothetical protein